MAEKSGEGAAHWTFLTNHAHVLVCLSKGHHDTLREVANCVGITERAVQRIVADLETANIITREKEGRRNTYQVNLDVHLRHDLEAHKTIGDLMEMVKSGEPIEN
jgi:predicted transcriptional regulator